MVGLLAMFVGGTIAVFLLQGLLEWVLFKRVVDDPVVGKVGSTVAAYVLSVILYGFGAADGGAWRPDGLINYLPGALIVGFFALKRGTKLREQTAAKDDVSDVFE